jgi:benzoate 4-monooxygenase
VIKPCLASISSGLIELSRKFLVFFNGQHHLVEQKLHEKHGHVIRTGPNSLSFSSLPAFEAIYGFNRSLEKGDFYDFNRDADGRAGSVFSARTDAEHREQRRKVVGPAFSPGKIAAYEPVILKNVSYLISRLAEAHSRSRDDQIVNIAPCIHRYTFDTIIALIYGEPICSQPYTDTVEARDILTGFRVHSKLAWGASLLPWFGWLMSTRPMVQLTRRPTYDVEGNMTSIAALATQTRDLILGHPERALESSQPSILKSYLTVPDSDTKHMVADQTWRECFNLTFAGPGSTAAALTSILYELGSASGREWQNRIRAGSSAETGTGSPSTLLSAVIKETMRLHAPFPTEFPRGITAGAETAIPGLPEPLPIGTVVASNTYVLGRSKEVWGEDAEMWKPERWLVAADEKQRLEEKFVVFSKGPRGCLGRDIAMLMLEKAVVGVLEKWDITAKGSLVGASFLEMQYAECGIAFAERRND